MGDSVPNGLYSVPTPSDSVPMHRRRITGCGIRFLRAKFGSTKHHIWFQLLGFDSTTFRNAWIPLCSVTRLVVIEYINLIMDSVQRSSIQGESVSGFDGFLTTLFVLQVKEGVYLVGRRNIRLLLVIHCLLHGGHEQGTTIVAMQNLMCVSPRNGCSLFGCDFGHGKVEEVVVGVLNCFLDVVLFDFCGVLCRFTST